MLDLRIAVPSATAAVEGLPIQGHFRSARLTCQPGEVRYLLLFAIVFGVNLLPAFGPPTWTLLVFARLNWHLEPVAIVLIGAVAAMSGRYVLAIGTRHVRDRLSDRRRANLEAANDLLFAKKGRAWAVLAVFVISPLPSAQLFVAAGLLDVALVPLTLAFFVGRLASYSFYVAAATLAEHQFGGVLRNALGSPWSIALQLLLLAGAAALPFVNWSQIGDRGRSRGGNNHRDTSSGGDGSDHGEPPVR
jgi:membrane protein YqaA with SNARE-associated domain